ncbi:MAG: Asp-tRNA(Asn)/Glu-tRNA(Gln) amidotransferase subunit GatB [Synergistaceae bacterium]|jgi:aspartyl-tRNA(Asn)/glutamyl-tRNA(Gln) amidotransferase subunit B|nr:Asp-tRNA(Asn)/Glu-tRNA(Gln) amidotransferase subunit GatB [Synergistaceae bacterium]MDY0283753.1 Asp-tRNA(Asn)/Glu-tRNA(Gln) amidotransferase subunit GatB [Synergistaceae bacterium]
MKRRSVIGLEIHLQLKTKTKLFCSCSSDYIGATPNTNICPVCLAVPGTLPILNDHAVELGVKIGLGLHCSISDNTRFHRKHYFYADLPKAYQITQYEHPIAVGGYVDIFADGKEKRVRVHHLHLEEDAGKLVHPTSDGRLTGASYSLVDYNRGGMPLSEIVSEPDMNSAEEAIAYITQIRQLARYLEVSDGEMESGSLRVDVNVSLSNPDGSLGTRVEIKNVNSLRSIERALEYEIARQNKVLDEGGHLVQETRLWDDVAGVTRSMRSKEGERDYRYYVEMDLAPISAGPEYVQKIRESLPEMPWEKRERFISEYSLSLEESLQLTEQKEAADYFEACVSEGAPAAKCANWMRMEVQRILRDLGIGINEFPVPASELGKLIIKVEKRELSNTQAKDVLAVMVEKKASLKEAVGLCGISDGRITGHALEEVIRKIFASEPEAVETIKSGNDKKGAKVKFLQGLVMRETRGSADPAEVASLVNSMLG